MKTIFTLLVSISMLISTGMMAQNPTSKKKAKFIHQKHNFSSKALLPDQYSFSMSTATYTDLTGATSINNTDVWDDPEYVIPVDISFKLYGKTLDSLYFGIGVGAALSDLITTNIDPEYLILPFECDLIDRGDLSGTTSSPISYKVEGTAPNRILKVEWKNAGFYMEGDSLGTYNDYINIQVWLYETSNNIEFHYGPSQLSYPNIEYEEETGAIIGLSDYDLLDAYLLAGPVANPIVLRDSLNFINGTPTNGTVYKFTKLTVGMEQTNSDLSSTKIYPNPAQNRIMIEAKAAMTGNIQMQSLNGKIIKSVDINGERKYEMSSENIPNGLYLLRFVSSNSNENFTKKVSILK